MKKILLFLLLVLPFLGQSQCTTTNATSCQCPTGGTSCNLLPDIHVARPPLLVNGSNGYLEYPQVCNPPCSGNDGRLRVSVSTPNVGFGPLEVRAIPTAICGTDTFYNVPSTFSCPNGQPLRQVINQRVYVKNGNTMTFFDRFAGSMTYHPSHSHMHVDDWGIYTLRTATADPNPLNWPVVGTGSKLAFCLMDYGSCSTYNGHCTDANGNTLTNSNFPNFGLGGGSYGCSPTVQGISSGYTDIYYQSLDGMWINLPPGLCNGQYYMVVQLDPYNYFLESNENNNVMAVPVTLTQQGGSTPVITASGATTFCAGGSVSLTATSGSSYLWSNGATTQSITVNQSGNYSCTVSFAGGCSATSAATTVSVSQIPVTASASNTSICPGENVNLNAVASGGGTTNQAVSFTNSTVIAIPDNNATGIQSLIQVNNIDPLTINSNTVVSVQVNITHTYTGDLVVALIAPSGNSINLSNRRGGSGNNFNNTLFTASASLAISQGSAPFSGSFRPDGPFSSLTGNSNGTWVLKVTDLAGTDIGTLNSWTLTLNDVVPTTLSYNWSSLPSGFSSQLQNPSASPSTTTTYNVIATESGTGCTGSGSVTVQVGNAINVTANNPAPICAGQSATLNASGASTYSWSPSTGLNQTNGASVQASPSATTNYMVVGNSNGCLDTAYVTLVVNQAPVLNVSPGTSICNGSSTTLQAGGATTYNWSPSSGLNGTSGASVIASPSQTTTYTVTGSSNGCESNAQITVTVNSLPVVNASSSTTICAGQSTNLNASGAISYVWSPSTGLNQSTGASVLASPTASTLYEVTGTDANGCTGTATVNVNVNDIPSPLSSISGNANSCLPLTTSYSVNPVNNASSYNWTVPNGVSITGGQGSTLINVSASTAVSGAICVTAQNSCGNTAPSCMNISTSASKPVTPGSITGGSKACPGDVFPYSVVAVSGATSYDWTIPAGTTIISGSGSNAISLQFNAGYAGGVLAVNASNACGSSTNRSRTLSVNNPATPSTISGQNFGLCNSTQLHSVTNVAGITYNWTPPAGATILSGQGTNSVSVNYGSGFISGNLAVTASNACSTSAARIRSVRAAPNQPGSISGPVSVCTGQSGVSYSITPVAGATTYNWIAPTGANIASGQNTTNTGVNFGSSPTTSNLRVRAGNACGNSSYRFLSITSAACPKISDFEQNVVSLSVMPNPASTYIEVAYRSTSESRAEVRISNILGQTLYQQIVNPEKGLNNYMIDLRKLAKGVYILSVIQDGKQEAQRLVIE
jgi:subtilisin-like proprotein convertase family protein